MALQSPIGLVGNTDKRLIVCVDMAEFDAMNTQILDWLEARDPSVHGDCWTEPIIHPVSGDIGFVVDMLRMSAALTTAQLIRCIDITPDWFPTQN